MVVYGISSTVMVIKFKNLNLELCEYFETFYLQKFTDGLKDHQSSHVDEQS